jgi:hypothetical protein
MLEAALRYLGYGWAVIPCGKDKKSIIKWEEYQHRLPTEEEVKGWWKQHPGANVAIVTGKISGLTVIDVDSDEGDQALWDFFPEVFETVQADTPRGRHYYCRYSEGIKNSTGWIKDCDIRSEGGYVIAPPSGGLTGNWKWVFAPEDFAAAPVPEGVLRKLSREPRSAPPPRGLVFSKGSRDENLFTVAHSLIRGGMHEDDAKMVLEILAQNCDPPFSVREAIKKIQSASKRKHGEVSELLTEWIYGHTGSFSLSQVQFDQGITDRRGKQALSNAANRKVKEGVLKTTKEAGRFTIVESALEPIDFMSASGDEVPLRWPLGVDKFFKLFPKNVCVVAGEQNAGKTAYLLAMSALNMKEHQIYYFSSEMGSEEFKIRLGLFQPHIKLDDWVKHGFHPYERDSNFEDVIRPNDVNIIDYLEVDGAIGREFWRVGGMLKDIRDRLDKGIAIVAIQKNPDNKEGHNLGLGGYRGMEKPRLYLTISQNPNRIRLEKVKNRRGEGNPNGLCRKFKLIAGCRFREDGEWHHKNIGGEY